MTSKELNEKYFKWMYQLVTDDRQSRSSYRKLLHHLYRTAFYYSMEMDENRAIDGVKLRYRFGYEYGYSRQEIQDLLDTCECSVLEMMVALAIRCEDQIMNNPDLGNRTGQWFWGMVNNLGLGRMNDSHYDYDYAADVISDLLDRRYERNGRGGLFTVENSPKDLRITDIWYQMCWHLNSLL